MTNELQKIAEKDFIKVLITQNNIEISIKYSKRSTLKKRFKSIDKLKEVLRTI